VRGILALVRERSAGRRGGAVRRLWAEGDVPWTAVPGVASARSLARGSVRHTTRATQVRGIRAA